MTGPERGLRLGVDGGGSKTVALVAAPDGRVVGAGRGGNADVYHNADAEAEVAGAIASALDSAGARADELRGAALSLVGADWPEDFERWRRALPRLGLDALPADAIRIVNDAIGALHSCSHAGPALAIVCGTGGATGARGADGATWHSSFWQRTQGAVELSLRALDAVYRSELGIDPPTALTALALEHFGVPDVERLLHDFTTRTRPPPAHPGRFAPHVLHAAAEGDAAARGIALAHADALAEYGLAAARRVGMDAATAADVVLAGGLFRHEAGLVAERAWTRLRAGLPGARRIEATPEPVAGALAIAFEAAGIVPDDTVRERLHASLPPAIFFRTDVVDVPDHLRQPPAREADETC